MSAANHTPTPWVYSTATDGTCSIWCDHDVKVIGRAATETNAAFIVRAVNSHDELVAALRKVSAGISPDMDSKDCDYLRGLIRAAFAKVKP